MTSSESSKGAGYLAAQRRRKELVALADQLGDICAEVSIPALADRFRAVADRVRDDAFVITVLGDFNTGKSTLINALLGADALPRLPVECTAALTEVRWAEQPRAEVYPYQGDDIIDQPEPAQVDRLRDLIVVDTDDPERRGKYGRAVVYWPLELCRNDVRIVDSPGLNADPAREKLTLEYLTATDAVVFVMHSQANMKLNEVQFMKAYLDNHDPFFVFNFDNTILPEDKKLVRDAAKVRLAKARPDHRDVDSRRMLWVDALAAMKARIGDDDPAWEASGVARLEADLERFLTTERHKMKILVSARKMPELIKELKRSVADQLRANELSVDELRRRLSDAQQPLSACQQEAARITRDLDNGIAELRDYVTDRVRNCLVHFAGQVGGWAEESVPDNKLSLRLWKTKQQAEELIAEVAGIVARRLEVEFAEWVGGELESDLEQRIAAIIARTDRGVTDFQQNLDALRINASGMAETARGVGDEDESQLSKLLAGVGGFVLAGPAAGLAGFRFGPREMAKALLPSLAIGVAWMFTPFGLPTLIAGLAAQALFGGFRTLRGMEQKIKRKIGEEMAREIRARAGEEARQAATGFTDQFDEFRTAVRTSLDGQIQTFRQTFDVALKNKQSGEAAAAAAQANLAKRDDEVDEAVFRLTEIIDEIAAI